jgi:Zn finger protein HypA/HybF involved in hydrogenase expression
VLEEPTYLRCADCDELARVSDLALQPDGRRTCPSCTAEALRQARARRELEGLGQLRLWT